VAFAALIVVIVRRQFLDVATVSSGCMAATVCRLVPGTGVTAGTALAGLAAIVVARWATGTGRIAPLLRLAARELAIMGATIGIAVVLSTPGYPTQPRVPQCWPGRKDAFRPRQFTIRPGRRTGAHPGAYQGEQTWAVCPGGTG
jgi:hypothetical protein